MEARQRAAAYLAGLVRRLESEGRKAVPAALTGRVAPTLVRYAEEEGIGLVVLTTHGRGGVERSC